MTGSNSLDVQLRSLLETSEASLAWRPQHFVLTNPDDALALTTLLQTRHPLVNDSIDAQLEELCMARAPFKTWNRETLADAIATELAGTSKSYYGTWVYYPWLNRVVHVLPREAYRELRSDRNRYKVTSEECATLQSKAIGIVGLSVGQTIALTLALEGVAGTIRLADFDTLSLSNMNRLLASAYDIGVNKAVLAARRLFEIDPYLHVEIFAQGITPDTMDAFLHGDGQSLDLLIEECDDLFVKVRMRECARAAGIAVLMATSDRGLLDVERYDLEPQRPLFHGLTGELKAEQLVGLSTRDKIPYVLQILGSDTMSPGLAGSLVEVKESLHTWPQLASNVMLGAAMTTDVARRILLGRFSDSGRYMMDPETQIRNGHGAQALTTAPVQVEVVEEALGPHAAVRRPLPQRLSTITEAEVRYMVTHGAMAPSGGNAQPWRFVFKNQSLECYVDTRSEDTLLDFENTASTLAVGAAIENIDLAAANLGLRVLADYFPRSSEPDLACVLHFERSAAPLGHSDLFAQIRHRVTNRKYGRALPLQACDEAALYESIRDTRATLQIRKDKASLQAIGEILGVGDRLRFLSQTMHRELMRELVWSGEEALQTRVGIDLSTLELSVGDRAAMRVLASWPNMQFLKDAKAGRGLESTAKKALAQTSAMGLLTIDGSRATDYLEGGRALERLWLQATERKVAIQPYSALSYLFARLERGDGDGFSREEMATLRELRQRYGELFDIPEGHSELLLFRISYADAPTARSLRRPLDAILTIEREGKVEKETSISAYEETMPLLNESHWHSRDEHSLPVAPALVPGALIARKRVE